MSQILIRNTLLTQAITTLTPVVGADIAYENGGFDPAGKSIWAAFYFFPATSESAGKSLAASDEERGFIQLSVYIKKDLVTYDNTVLAAVDTIKNDFYFGKVIGNVMILDVTTNAGAYSEGWHFRNVTINYTSFESRT